MQAMLQFNSRTPVGSIGKRSVRNLLSWLETGSDQTDFYDDYESRVRTSQDSTEEVIKTKQVCKDSKVYWTTKFTEKIKSSRRLNTDFYKRSDISNAKIVDVCGP